MTYQTNKLHKKTATHTVKDLAAKLTYPEAPWSGATAAGLFSISVLTPHFPLALVEECDFLHIYRFIFTLTHQFVDKILLLALPIQFGLSLIIVVQST